MQVVYATSTTNVVTEHGVPVPLVKGEPWDANDPTVKRHPGLFTKEPVWVKTEKGWMRSADVVEQATAAPGEKRRRA